MGNTNGGNPTKAKSNLAKLLNLNYLRYSNKTHSAGEKDLPALYCTTEVYPDFLALYSEPGLYCATNKTAVCFFNYDESFDGKNGLFWAIYYNDEERLNYFRKRFCGVRYFISPDYSELGDIHWVENEYRLFKARIVSLWLILELNAIVIPNITFPTESSYQFALSGLEECKVVCISTKGHIGNQLEFQRLKKNIQLTTDTLHNLQAIIVYDVCGTDEAACEAFSYAYERGIKIVIPRNTLKNQNQEKALKK